MLSLQYYCGRYMGSKKIGALHNSNGCVTIIFGEKGGDIFSGEKRKGVNKGVNQRNSQRSFDPRKKNRKKKHFLLWPSRNSRFVTLEKHREYSLSILEKIRPSVTIGRVCHNITGDTTLSMAP